MILAKQCQIFLHFDLLKITLQITDFFKLQKLAFFSKGLTHDFGQKMLFFLYLDLIKIRLEIMLSDFQEKKEPFLTIKKRIF